MGRDKTIREQQEQEVAAELAAAWCAGGPAKPVLDRALADGLNVSRIKTMARAMDGREAPAPAKPKRTRTRATLTSLMLLGLLAGCAAGIAAPAKPDFSGLAPDLEVDANFPDNGPFAELGHGQAVDPLAEEVVAGADPVADEIEALADAQ